MSECPITGTAVVDVDHTGRMRWHKADHAIHISTELLESMDDAARAFFDAKYGLDEWCPHGPFARHARLRAIP